MKLCEETHSDNDLEVPGLFSLVFLYKTSDNNRLFSIQLRIKLQSYQTIASTRPSFDMCIDVDFCMVVYWFKGVLN